MLALGLCFVLDAHLGSKEWVRRSFKHTQVFALVLLKAIQEEAWRRGCDVGSHTHGQATPGHISLCLQISLISAPSCCVPCPDGIKLQSLDIVRFRNWCRELGMTIATTSSS